MSSTKINKETKSLESQLIEIPLDDLDETKKVIQMFNVNQAKKEALRLSTQNKVMDGALDQLNKRMQERPDEFTNKDLLDTVNVIHQAMNRSSQGMSGIEDVTIINVKQENNITLGEDSFNSDSANKIKEAVRRLMSKAEKDIIDVEVVEDDSNGV